MSIRVILVMVGLGLAVVTVAPARPQDAASPAGGETIALRDTAELRTRIATLRAEVELMEIEHEVEKTRLTDLLKNAGDSQDDLEAKAWEEVSKATMIAAQIGKLEEFKKESGGEEEMRRVTREEMKKHAEKLRADGDQRKTLFVKTTTELNEKKLELAVLERHLKKAR